MSYITPPDLESLPSARARIAKIREQSKANLAIMEAKADAAANAGNRDMALACGAKIMQFQTHELILSVADILLDAMKDGPDVSPVRTRSSNPL
jgi:hypothetical protein